MKKLVTSFTIILLIFSCESDFNMLGSLTVSTEITSDYLLEGDLDLYLGNQQVVRYKGKPGVETIFIGSDLSDYEDCFVLNIASGSESEGNVSSAIVKIDGIEILNTSDFSNEYVLFAFEICYLNIDSYMEIEIRGEPGSYLDIWIEGKLKSLIPAESIVLYCPFDGNTNDLSGNNNHGTFHGGTPSYISDVQDNPNSALNLAGRDNYVQIPNNAYTTFGDEDFSISLLFKTYDEHGTLFSTRNTSACEDDFGPFVRLRFVVEYVLSFDVWGSNGYIQLHNKRLIFPSDDWHILIITYRKGDKVTFYRDNYEYSGSGNLGDLSTSGDLFIGRTIYCEGDHFMGAIDEFKKYNIALSEDQVAELYETYGFSMD